MSVPFSYFVSLNANMTPAEVLNSVSLIQSWHKTAYLLKDFFVNDTSVVDMTSLYSPDLDCIVFENEDDIVTTDGQILTGKQARTVITLGALLAKRAQAPTTATTHVVAGGSQTVVNTEVRALDGYDHIKACGLTPVQFGQRRQLQVTGTTIRVTGDDVSRLAGVEFPARDIMSVQPGYVSVWAAVAAKGRFVAHGQGFIFQAY